MRELALLVVVAACAKDAEPAPAPPAPPAPALTASRLEVDDLDAAAALARQGGAPGAIVSALRDRLGPPTLDRGRTVYWAGRHEDFCAELIARVSDGGVDVERGDPSRGSFEYTACIDAADGVARAPDRVEQARGLLDAGDRATMLGRAFAALGEPTARAEKSKILTLAWATADADRCDWIRAWIASGGMHADTGSAYAGTPWYAACRGWSTGSSASIADRLMIDPTRYASLTGADNPRRVDAAWEMFSVAVMLSTAKDPMLLESLAPPRVALDPASGWAVDDGERCVYLWWTGEGGHMLLEPKPGDAERLTCRAIARGDRRTVAMRMISPRDDARAWTARYLGAPDRAQDGVQSWAHVDPGWCVESDLRDGAYQTAMFQPSDDRFADCAQIAAAR
jgi:hypothetical protein